MSQRTSPAAAAGVRAGVAQFLARLHVSGFALLCLGLLVLGVLMLAPSVKLLLEQQREIADLKAQVAQAQQTVDDRTEEIARWSDPAYVRSQVRERLYYVMPGEIAYLVIDDVPVSDDAIEEVSDSIGTTEVNWLEGLAASTLIAGAGSPQPDALLGPQQANTKTTESMKGKQQ